MSRQDETDPGVDIGYPFTCRRETAQEYLERTGQAAPPPAGPALPRRRRFLLSADFVDHDARFAGSAQAVVCLAEPPAWTEAEQILYPVMREQIIANSGSGEWWPSFTRLDVRELLD